MRILQVVPFFSPQMGGSVRVVHQLAATLTGKGHQVTVLASDYGHGESSFESSDYELVIFPNILAHSGFYLSPGMISWCRKHLSSYDIIHLHETRTFQNIVIRRFALQAGIPYVLSAHGTLPVIMQRKWAKWLYDLFFGRRLLRDARLLLAVSPMEKEQYLRAGVDEARIRIVPNGLVLGEFVRLPSKGTFRRQWGIPLRDRPIVLYLGRLHRVKGIDTLVRAYSKVRSRCPEAVLVIAGPDAGELSGLKALMKSLGLQEQVLFTGPLYSRDRLAALADADVVVAPSRYEIFGLVPFEALMCGTPVIVSEGSGSGELIAAAGAGYLSPFGDTEGLAGAISNVLLNPEQAEGLVAAGQIYVQNKLSWEIIAAEFEDIFAQVGITGQVTSVNSSLMSLLG